MRIFLIVLILLSAVILQTTLIPFLAVSGAVPNLVLILVLILVIFKGFKKMWPACLLAGFFLDLFSGLPFGLISLSLVGAVYLVDWFNNNFFPTVKLWIAANLVVMGTLLYNLFLIGFGKLFQVDLIFNLRYLLIEIIYNLLITVLFFHAAKKVFRQE